MVGFADWLCNLLLWGAIIALGGLTYSSFVTPVITEMNALIGLGVIAVLSVFWPRY